MIVLVAVLVSVVVTILGSITNLVTPFSMVICVGTLESTNL